MDLGGSTPSRRTDKTARSSNGSGCETLNLAIAGSTPVRAAYGEVVESVDTQRSDRRALEAWEFDSPLRHSIAGLAGA